MNSLRKTVENIFKENKISKNTFDSTLKLANNYLLNIFDEIGVSIKELKEACGLNNNQPILINDKVEYILKQRIENYEGFPKKTEITQALEYTTPLMSEINIVIENILKENFKEKSALSLRFEIEGKLSEIVNNNRKRLEDMKKINIEIENTRDSVSIPYISFALANPCRSYELFISTGYNDDIQIDCLSQRAQSALDLIRFNHLLDMYINAYNYGERFFSIERTDDKE